MSYKPKRSADSYIQFKKTITNKEVIKLVSTICTETLMSENDVLYKFIADYVLMENKRREDLKL